MTCAGLRWAQDAMSEPSEGLSWGCYAPRPYCNLLSGSAPVPSGDRCAAQFLLFDAQERALTLCRYDAGSGVPCRVQRLQLDALRNPRQLLLSSKLPIFASLDLVAGAATVAVWHLTSGSLIGTLEASGAKAICWAGRTLPQVPSCAGEELLSVLLAEAVLLAVVKTSGDSWCVEQRQSLNLHFPCRCLCWSNDGTQLLVGGKAQLTCFVFAGDTPSSRQLLCTGECVEIQAVFANSFLCRIEQCSPPEADNIMMPGQALPSRPLVQVVENPQDGPSEPIPPSFTLQNPVTADLGIGLQVVPCQRYLLPIRCTMSDAKRQLICQPSH